MTDKAPVRKEKWVKAQVVKMLKDIDAYYFFPVASGWMSNGVPDIIACINGRFVGIECKAGKNGTTAIQDKNLVSIKKNGGVALIVNETKLTQLEIILNGLSKQTHHIQYVQPISEGAGIEYADK
jgi:Holliday junction resolvase